ERADRRGRSRVLPVADIVCLGRISELELVGLAHRAQPFLVAWTAAGTDVVRWRPAPRTNRSGDRRLRRERRRLPADCAQWLKGSRRQPGGIAHPAGRSGGSGRSCAERAPGGGSDHQPVQGGPCELPECGGRAGDGTRQRKNRGGSAEPAAGSQRTAGQGLGRRLECGGSADFGSAGAGRSLSAPENPECRSDTMTLFAKLPRAERENERKITNRYTTERMPQRIER